MQNSKTQKLKTPKLKQWLLASLIAMGMTIAWHNTCQAYDFAAGGLYYNIMSVTGTAQVTSGDVPYSGNVVVPGTVTHEGRSLEVTAIGDRAFAGCNALKAVTLGERVKTIGNRAFLDCTSLTQVEITAAVTTIGDYAFARCSSLKTVTCNNSAPIEIGAGAFLQCSQLMRVKWPSAQNLDGRGGIASLGTRAFAQCPALESMRLPGDIQTMGTAIFDGCTALSNITLTSATPLKLTGDPFGLEESVIVYVPSSGTPGETKDLYATAQGWRQYTIMELLFSFFDNDNYTYLKNPGTTTVTLTKCLDPNKEDVMVRSTITDFDGSIMTVSAIAPQAFKGKPVKTLDTSGSRNLKHIGAEAFAGCQQLTTAKLGEGVATMGERAFAQCISLTTVQVPSTLQVITTAAFEDCSSLEDVNLTLGVNTLQSNAFARCSNLRTIGLPRSMAAIAPDAFAQCPALESINVDPRCSHYADVEGVLFERKFGEDFESDEIGYMHKMIIYPMSKPSEDYYIPSGVAIIADNAMQGAIHLKHLAIPATTTTFGNNCFEGTNIEKFNYRNPNPSDETTAGFNAAVKARATLQVPVGTMQRYQALTAWQGFKNVEELPHVMQDQQFAYDWNSSNTGVGIVSMHDNAVDDNGLLTIPSQVTMSDYTYYVTTLSSNSTQQVAPRVLRLDIQADSLAVIDTDGGINPLAAMNNLQHIALTQHNPYFKIEGDVLYNKPGSVLCFYPQFITQQQFTMPPTVETVMPQAMAWNSSLTSVTVSTALKQLGDGAMEGCSALRHIYNAKNVNIIGNRAFLGCTSLKDFNGGERLNQIGDEAFLNCSNLRAFPFAHGMLKSIGSKAFKGCGSLGSAALGLNLTHVGDRAFEYCTALNQVVFSAPLENLGTKAFKGCSALTELWLYNDTPPSDADNQLFGSSSLNSLHLYVPQPSSYQQQAPWNSAASINSSSYLVDGPDVNGDKVINSLDVTIIMSVLLGDFDGELVGHLDVNHDGTITATDVTVIYEFILNGSSSSMAYKFVQQGNSNISNSMKQGTTTRVMCVNQNTSQYVTTGLTGYIHNSAVATIAQGVNSNGVPYLDITAVTPGYFTLVAVVNDGNSYYYRTFPIVVTY